MGESGYISSGKMRKEIGIVSFNKPSLRKTEEGRKGEGEVC